MYLLITFFGLADYGKHVPLVGPYAPTSRKLVKFGDVDDLQEALEADADKIAAFMIEPIQGASG
jgi:ornithine--oxo-acid transaminase